MLCSRPSRKRRWFLGMHRRPEKNPSMIPFLQLTRHLWGGTWKINFLLKGPLGGRVPKWDAQPRDSLARSSSREVRIMVPFVFSVYFSTGSLPQGERTALLRDLVCHLKKDSASLTTPALSRKPIGVPPKMEVSQPEGRLVEGSRRPPTIFSPSVQEPVLKAPHIGFLYAGGISATGRCNTKKPEREKT